jgi:release factor glutamine methyltransferase
MPNIFLDQTPECVAEALKYTARALASHGIEDSSREALMLVSLATSMSAIELYMEPGRELTSDQLCTLQKFVDRRQSREPLAYIAGTSEFYGLKFTVDRRVLIPRPETELLLERSIEAAQRLRDRGCDSLLVADIVLVAVVLLFL